jgi:hypothetical protein
MINSQSGASNTAVGHASLAQNVHGAANTALGAKAMYENFQGGNNVAIGYRALENIDNGFNNIAIGTEAGTNLTTGGNNIYIDHNGGAGGETLTTRIGDVQERAFVAGVWGTPVSGSWVLVTSSGQLGYLSSSRRFKESVEELGELSEKLQDLRPVRFHYRQEVPGHDGAAQYGLIAEEVAEVLPELVTDDDGGRPSAIRYHLLIPMLVGEIQRQEGEIHSLRQANDRLERALVRIEARLADLE